MPDTVLFPHLQSMCIDGIALDADNVTMTVAVKSVTADCPLCQCPATRVHSRYKRTVADLPISGEDRRKGKYSTVGS